jgi:hypothetical protein
MCATDRPVSSFLVTRAKYLGMGHHTFDIYHSFLFLSLWMVYVQNITIFGEIQPHFH